MVCHKGCLKVHSGGSWKMSWEFLLITQWLSWCVETVWKPWGSACFIQELTSSRTSEALETGRCEIDCNGKRSAVSRFNSSYTWNNNNPQRNSSDEEKMHPHSQAHAYFSYKKNACFRPISYVFLFFLLCSKVVYLNGKDGLLPVNVEPSISRPQQWLDKGIKKITDHWQKSTS